MNTQIRHLAIVVPSHNEADNIEPLARRLQEVASTLPSWNVQVLFVDDGSTDHSIEILNRLRNQGLPVGYLRLSRNFGHQAALEAGLHAVAGDAVITMDGDLQHPPEEIPHMLQAFEEGADVVQMVRDQQPTGGKGLYSDLFYKVFASVAHSDIVPGAADFRLLSRRVVEVVKQIPEREKFLRALIPTLGFKQVNLVFTQAERKSGKPSYSFRKSAKLARKAIFDFSSTPLRIVFWCGTIFALVSFAFAVNAVVRKLVGLPGILPGYTDIIASILFLSGLILASIGILGRYLLMILDQLRGRPSFIVVEQARPEPLPNRIADRNLPR